MLNQPIDVFQLPVAPTLHWFEEWSLWLRNDEFKRGGGRLEKNSLEAYSMSVQHFIHWYEHVRPASAVFEIRFSLTHFTTEVVSEYFRWQEEQRVPAKSWNHRLTSLRKVVKWAMRLGHLQDDPTRVIGRIYKIESTPREIKNEDFARLETVATEAAHLKRETELWSKLGLRDQVIWHLLSVALRVSEVTNADLRDLDLDNGRLRVIGKGNVEGDVILTQEAVTIIRDWLAVRSTLRFAAAHTTVLTNWNGNAITSGQVWRRYKQMCAKAGIKSTTHEMRHTTVHRMIRDFQRQGFSLSDAVRAAGDQARQRDPRTTWSYTRVSEEQVRAALEAR